MEVIQQEMPSVNRGGQSGQASRRRSNTCVESQRMIKERKIWREGLAEE